MFRRLFRVVSSDVSRFQDSSSLSVVPVVFKRRSTHYRYPPVAIGKPKEKSIMAAINKSMYMYPNDTPICALDCVDAFNTLTDKEKRYAYFVAKASFDGSLIVFCQVSPESPALFVILYRLFSSESIESLRKKSIDLNWSESEFTALLVFTAGFYANNGNYKGFGDTKIVPGVSPDKFRALLEKSEASKKYANFMKLYRSIEEHVFSLEAKDLNLGFPDKAVTGYHSQLVTKADTDLIDRYFQSKHMEGWNTRLVKKTDGNKVLYVVRLASLAKSEQSREEFEGATVIIERGDYAPILSHTIKSLKEALGYVANENQKNMISKYITHFETGNIVDHMDGSRFWIKDKGPSVESYIGFIENYRDPAGTRAEFEGFVAAVNKETSKKFHELVRRAEELLARLPWDKEYEKDKFLKPDFTSLDVIAFGGSGIPAGINIPNYDAIRQNEGFKNVSLGNVISAMPKQKINFLIKEDEVSSWYEPGETWSSKFGALSSAYEECRAEAVGYFLCTYPDVLKIFGHEGEMAETIKYVNWMSEIRAGLLALEFYSPDAKNWGQAHCFARYTLLQVCLEAGNEFVTITEKSGEDGKPDLLFKLDPKKIDSVGKPAVGAFLRKLQVGVSSSAYKSTGDSVGGSKFFNEVGAVKGKNLKWREIVIARRQPRRLFVQSNTVLNEKGEWERGPMNVFDFHPLKKTFGGVTESKLCFYLLAGDVVLKTYPETFEGIIQSVVDRYSPQIVADLETLWCGDPHFSLTH
uniref:Dipeptidyl peptidase 3 n=1 Tax=Ascaris lumbricoides TaxID=6252 RepID=A0A0M3HQ99_ASCLU